MAIRAVLLDFGGTLFSYGGAVRSGFEALLRRVAARHGIEAPLPELRQRWIAAMGRTAAAYAPRPFYLHRDLFFDALDAFLVGHGARAAPADREAFYRAQTQLAEPVIEPREGAREALAALRAGGRHLGVVSNIDDDQFAVLWPRIGLASLVDSTTTSEEVRSCKPHPAIFRAALAKTGGAAAEETLFVGDSLHQDVAGANAAGMRSVLLTRVAPASDAPHRPHHVIADLRELVALADA